jgi:hypothetical protein
MFGVYQVLRDGSLKYVSRTVTHSEKLAQEIARDFTEGRCIMPDGSVKAIKPCKCIAAAIA